jgi:hypothetical protein
MEDLSGNVQKDNRGKRGKGKKDRYILNIMDGDNILFSETYKSQSDISTKLNIPRHTINRIYRGKFSYDKRKDSNKMYTKYQILKI